MLRQVIQSDYVSYSVVGKDHNHFFKNTPCYVHFNQMLKYDDDQIVDLFTNEMLANQGEGLSDKDYFEWIKFCRKLNWILEDAHPYVHKSKIGMLIPITADTNGKILYSTTCCFRWADCLCQTVCDILEDYRKLGDSVSSWQIFHYHFSKIMYNTGHSFICIAKGYASNISYSNVMVSAIGKILFDLPTLPNNKIVARRYKGFTDNITKLLYSVSNLLPGNKNLYGFDRYSHWEIPDILHSKWLPMYQVEVALEEQNELIKSLVEEISQVPQSLSNKLIETFNKISKT